MSLADDAPIELDGAGTALLALVIRQLGSDLAAVPAPMHYRRFAELTADWLWEMDAELRYTWLSDNIEKVTGAPSSWYLGRWRDDLPPPGETPEHWNAHLETLRRREPYRDYVFPIRTPGGDRWIRSHGAPVFDDDSAFQGYLGTGIDITAEVMVERRARDADDLLSMAIDSLTETIIIFDAVGRGGDVAGGTNGPLPQSGRAFRGSA